LVPDLQENLDTVRSLLSDLHILINENYLHFIERDFSEFNLQYQRVNQRLEELEEMVVPRSGDDKLTTGNALISEFNRFTISYENYVSNLPELLLLDSRRYRLQIIGIIILNLGFLFLAGFLILRLIDQLILADRNLVRKTIEVENRERERIAADLHDGLGSLLSGIIIHIQVLEKEYGKNATLKKQLKHLNYLSNHALLSIEEVINNLNPSSLARNGLIKSLKKNISKINELGKTQFSVNANELNIQFPESTESLLYRICNELINNALKHSGAESAEFRFFNIKKEFHLVYQDDGVGFSPELKSYEDDKGGLYNLMRRVESLEGTLKINSEPDRGVEIEIVFNIG
ncbi:MAG: sensor histidine kinase, partial [Bacteroidales bacterium]